MTYRWRRHWLVAFHKAGHDVYGHREDDGAVVLCRDAVQGLEVAQLKDKFLISSQVFL